MPLQQLTLGDGQYCTVASSSKTATTISGSESWRSDRSTIYALYAVTFTSTAIIATMMLEADVSMGVAAPADDLGILGEILDPEEEHSPPSDTTLTLRPQKGHIYIDDVLEGQVFTDSALLQRKILPEPPCGGGWQLAYDDDGYAGLISEDGDTLLQVSTFLGMAIYQVADGMLHCVDCTKGSTEVWNYTDRLQEHTSRTGELRIIDNGGLGTVIQLPVYQVRWPRGCGGRLLWAFNDELYKFLKLTCYKGQASKWFYVIFRLHIIYLRYCVIIYT